MKLKLHKTIVLLTLGAVAGWMLRTYSMGSSIRPPEKAVEVPSTTIGQATPIPYPDKEFYQSFLISKGLSTNAVPIFEDLTGNGKQAIFIAVGEGCGSCHYKEIHILDNKREIFTFYGDDVVLSPIVGLGFSLTQPVRKPDESYSSPSEYQSAIYLWNGKIFVKSKTSSNWVDEPQTPG